MQQNKNDCGWWGWFRVNQNWLGGALHSERSTHITPEEGTGALGVSDLISDWLNNVSQLMNLKCAGGDSTNPITGW